MFNELIGQGLPLCDIWALTSAGLAAALFSLLHLLLLLLLQLLLVCLVRRGRHATVAL